jgi:hypothetical protein
MIRLTAKSQWATFEQVFSDESAAEAFQKHHELEELGWENVQFDHLGGVELDTYFKSLIGRLEPIKIESGDGRH